MSIPKRLLIAVAGGTLLGLIIIQAWIKYTKLPYDLSSSIYWLIFVNWILLIHIFRFKAKLSLSIGLIIVCIFVVLEGIITRSYFELFLRLGMVFWFTGIIHALVELIKSPKND